MPEETPAPRRHAKTEVSKPKSKGARAEPKEKKVTPPETEVTIKDHPDLPQHHLNDDNAQHGRKKTVFIPRGPSVPTGGKRLRRYLQK